MFICICVPLNATNNQYVHVYVSLGQAEAVPTEKCSHSQTQCSVFFSLAVFTHGVVIDVQTTVFSLKRNINNRVEKLKKSKNI